MSNEDASQSELKSFGDFFADEDKQKEVLQDGQFVPDFDQLASNSMDDSKVEQQNVNVEDITEESAEGLQMGSIGNASEESNFNLDMDE